MVIEYLRTLKRLGRDVRLFLFTAALVGFTLFGGIASVLQNLFLLRLGYGPEFIGVFISSGMFALALVCLPAGALGARWGSRRAMMVGLSVAAAGSGMVALAEMLPQGVRAAWLVTSNIVASSGLALYVVNTSPFLMARVGPGERAHAFSAQGALWPLAAFAGSLAGGALPGLLAGPLGVGLDHPAPYRATLLISAALLLLGVLALAAVQEAPQAVQGDEPLDAEPGPLPLRAILLVSLVALLQVSGEGVARNFVNVYLDVRLGVPTAQIGTLLAVAQLAAAPAALATPLLAARWGQRRTYAFTALVMGLSMLPLALVPHWGAAGLGFVGVMVLASISRPAITVFQMELVEPRWRPTMAAATTMAVGLSWAGLALGAGFIITALGFTALFLIGAALTLAGVALFWACFRRPRPAPEPRRALVVPASDGL
jgi:MFS family permease